MIARVFNFIRFVIIFLKELIIANFEVAKIVLSPKLGIKPGFVSMPIESRTDFEVTSLANSVTLTPGTISVHVDSKNRENDTLVVHALCVGDDLDDVRDGIRNILEANILRWTRGPKDPAVARIEACAKPGQKPSLSAKQSEQHKDSDGGQA